jgi:hypothetical protein
MSFSRSWDFLEVVTTFQGILDKVGIQPGPINSFFPKIRFYLRSEVPRYTGGTSLSSSRRKRSGFVAVVVEYQTIGS